MRRRLFRCLGTIKALLVNTLFIIHSDALWIMQCTCDLREINNRDGVTRTVMANLFGLGSDREDFRRPSHAYGICLQKIVNQAKSESDLSLPRKVQYLSHKVYQARIIHKNANTLSRRPCSAKAVIVRDKKKK